jgi:hypothetical protein
LRYSQKFFEKILSSGSAVFDNPLAVELQQHRGATLADNTPLHGSSARIA